MVENYLCATEFYHVSRIGVIRGFHPMLAALFERWRPETHTFVLPIGEVTVILEDVAHIFGLHIDGEPVSGWTDSSSDFVQSQGIAIFGREPSVSHNAKSYIKLGWVRRIRDTELLDTEESIRALCHALRYDTKEMDGPLNLLFVWAWERMPCLAPVPRQTIPPAEIPVARRHDIDYMQEFEWRPYDGLIVPDNLHPHLEVCDIVASLLLFKCVEWHPADRVMRQFGYVQPPPGVPRDIPVVQHCIVLREVQLHDWTVLHGPWIVEWANRRHSRLQGLHPLPTWDFLPMAEYQDWYMCSYRYLLRLTSHGSHHTQGGHHSQQSQHSHHSQQSQHSHHSQHHDPILTIPSGHDWFDFSSDRHGDQQLQHWIDAGLGGWSDFSGIPSPSVPADPRRASVDVGHGLRGRTSDHTLESASCDSGFIQHQQAYAVVDTFNPGPSAPAEAGGSVAPIEAGGSAAPTDAGGSAAPTKAGSSGASGVDDSVRGHPYDLRTERNPPDRYTPSWLETGIMRKGLYWFVGKK
ncbi:Putative oligosaccharide biosynthesis protein [Arachis hypogaea]|nr:Putative oligosaccharide biosynthesis protein [Arachis hypogaea]